MRCRYTRVKADPANHHLQCTTSPTKIFPEVIVYDGAWNPLETESWEYTIEAEAGETDAEAVRKAGEVLEALNVDAQGIATWKPASGRVGRITKKAEVIP